jgi:hypothetical protein
MGIAVEMGQLMWQEDFHDDVTAPTRERATVEATGTPLEIPDDKTFDEFMAAITGGVQEELEQEIDEWDDVEFEIDSERQELLFDVFENFLAGIMIMADLCDVDLGVCMYNASIQTEI